MPIRNRSAPPVSQAARNGCRRPPRRRSGRVFDFISLLLEKLWTDLLDSCMKRSAIQFLADNENLTSIARSAAHIVVLPSIDKAGELKPGGYFHFWHTMLTPFAGSMGYQLLPSKLAWRSPTVSWRPSSLDAWIGPRDIDLGQKAFV